jgi:hypothetical protein
MSHQNNKNTTKPLSSRITMALALCFAMAAAPITGAQAQTVNAPITPITTEVVAASAQDIALASDTYLAHIITGDTRRDRLAEDGLTSLAQTLNNRTSIEPAGVVGIDIERDDISLFPFIYWPLSSNDRPLSEEARIRVQTYLDNGGMILFDVHDLRGNMISTQAISQIVGRLSIRPVEELNDEHTLTRSFYLLNQLRGSYNNDGVYVEQPGEPGTESVSNVIIGENNWAAAWAGRTVRAGSNEYEMSLRAGVNMLMYALTGEYKSDQLHINSTLDRLSR